jgi:hypothetical protein
MGWFGVKVSMSGVQQKKKKKKSSALEGESVGFSTVLAASSLYWPCKRTLNRGH